MLAAEFTRIFTQHSWFVLRIARQWVRGEDAEEVCQEVFLQLWRRRHSLLPTRALLATIARRAAWCLHARHRRRLETQSAALREHSRLQQSESTDLQIPSLDALPPSQSRAIKAVFVDGLSIAEAALRLQIPRPRLYKQLEAARSRLRRATRREPVH